MSVFLIKQHIMEAYDGVQVYLQAFSNLNTTGWRLVIFTAWELYTEERAPCYPLHVLEAGWAPQLL
jgi:hypothetical protein